MGRENTNAVLLQVRAGADLTTPCQLHDASSPCPPASYTGAAIDTSVLCCKQRGSRDRQREREREIEGGQGEQYRIGQLRDCIFFLSLLSKG